MFFYKLAGFFHQIGRFIIFQIVRSGCLTKTSSGRNPDQAYLVIMRSNFKQPLVLYLNSVPHVLLGGEDELVVDHPPGQILKQRRVRVYHHLLVMFYSLIVSTLVYKAFKIHLKVTLHIKTNLIFR